MATHLPQSKLVLDLRGLARHPGEMIRKHLDVSAPGDLAVALASVPEGSPLVIDLTCESAGDGVLVRGSAGATLTCQCARCLTHFEQSGQFTFDELYFYPGKGPDDDEGDALFVVDDCVDLDPVLRAAIVLSLPFAPLCRPDCAGICPQCGVDMNEHPGHAHEMAPDTRWDKLRDVQIHPTDRVL